MKQYTYSIFLIVITLFVVSCGNSDKNNGHNKDGSVVEDNRIKITKTQFKQSGMKLGMLEERPFPEIVKTTGKIDVPPQNRAVVSAIAGGVVKNTPLLIGDKVKKGQALMTIENTAFITMQQEYLEVKEQLTYLKSEYERQGMLLKENITSQKKFLKAQSDYKTAQAMYQGLRKKLLLLNISPTRVETGTIVSVATILAPINGSVTQMNITKGMHVSPATKLLEIIDNEHIHIELSVFEKDIMKIKEGQKIKFKISETSKETYQANVYLIGTSIGENRTIVVHGHLDKDTKQHFLTGMFVNAEIITESSMAKALPETALIEVEGKHYVLVLDSEDENMYYFKKIKVLKGQTYNDFSAVHDTKTFKDAEKFLVKGGFRLIAD